MGPHPCPAPSCAAGIHCEPVNAAVTVRNTAPRRPPWSRPTSPAPTSTSAPPRRPRSTRALRRRGRSMISPPPPFTRPPRTPAMPRYASCPRLAGLVLIAFTGAAHPPPARGPPPQARWADQRGPAQGQEGRWHATGPGRVGHGCCREDIGIADCILDDSPVHCADLAPPAPAVVYCDQPRREARHSKRKEDQQRHSRDLVRSDRRQERAGVNPGARPPGTAGVDARVECSQRLAQADGPHSAAGFCTRRGQLPSLLLGLWRRHLGHISAPGLHLAPTQSRCACTSARAASREALQDHVQEPVARSCTHRQVLSA